MSEGSEQPNKQGAIVIPEYARQIAARPPALPWGVVGVVAVKIGGFVLLLQGLPLLYLAPTYLVAFMASGRDLGLEFLLTLFLPTVHFGLGLFLIWRAHWVAVVVLGFSDAREEFGFRSPGRRFQALAFSVLGVWVAIVGASELTGVIASSVWSARMGSPEMAGIQWSDVVMPLVKLGAGVGLFFGAKRLAHYWHRFRMQPHGPVPRAPDNAG
jgi:hypothetical protein